MDIPGRLYEHGEEVYTDWFPRQGDGIILRLQAIDRKGSNIKSKIEVYTKNAEDTGAGTAISGWEKETDTPGTVYELIKVSDATGGGGAGLKEMVRLKVSTASGSDGDWILARIFPPIFFDAAG